MLACGARGGASEVVEGDALAGAASDGFVETQGFGVVVDGAPQATVREPRRAEWMTYPAVGTAPKTTGRPETCSNWPTWTVRLGASAAYVRHDIGLETVRGRLKNAEFAAAEAGLFDDAAVLACSRRSSTPCRRPAHRSLNSRRHPPSQRPRCLRQRGRLRRSPGRKLLEYLSRCSVGMEIRVATSTIVSACSSSSLSACPGPNRRRFRPRRAKSAASSDAGAASLVGGRGLVRRPVAAALTPVGW
ncbi:hypothetical protein A4R44_04034 [Amycolatopsis sp. M39]|nr:hypothetical protein A4R44_04034 [Amycolatopsis sp. M39]